MKDFMKAQDRLRAALDEGQQLAVPFTDEQIRATRETLAEASGESRTILAKAQKEAGAIRSIARRTATTLLGAAPRQTP
jgi:hypothetical protein